MLFVIALTLFIFVIWVFGVELYKSVYRSKNFGFVKIILYILITVLMLVLLCTGGFLIALQGYRPPKS